MRVSLSLLGAAKTERGYNACCKSFCSAMIAKWTALMNHFRLWSRRKFNVSYVRTSQKVKVVLMWNLQHIFIWRRRYCRRFLSIMINHSDNALLFWLIICDFSSKYSRTGIFNQPYIRNEHAANFQNKMYSKFQNI